MSSWITTAFPRWFTFLCVAQKLSRALWWNTLHGSETAFGPVRSWALEWTLLLSSVQRFPACLTCAEQKPHALICSSLVCAACGRFIFRRWPTSRYIALLGSPHVPRPVALLYCHYTSQLSHFCYPLLLDISQAPPGLTVSGAGRLVCDCQWSTALQGAQHTLGLVCRMYTPRNLWAHSGRAADTVNSCQVGLGQAEEGAPEGTWDKHSGSKRSAFPCTLLRGLFSFLIRCFSPESWCRNLSTIERHIWQP